MLCRLGFHDWHCFRLIHFANSWGHSVYDQVCLRCGKLKLDGTNGRKEIEERCQRASAVAANRDARAAAMIRGRIA